LRWVGSKTKMVISRISLIFDLAVTFCYTKLWCPLATSNISVTILKLCHRPWKCGVCVWLKLLPWQFWGHIWGSSLAWMLYTKKNLEYINTAIKVFIILDYISIRRHSIVVTCLCLELYSSCIIYLLMSVFLCHKSFLLPSLL